MAMPSKMMMRPPLSNRRQPFLQKQSKSVTGSVRFAEVAGGTTAECAAVFCCCPCITIEFLILAVYKVPAGLYRRALRTKRRHMLKKNEAIPARRGRNCGGYHDEMDIQILAAGKSLYSTETKGQNSDETERKVMELEKEMWEIFYGTGFWRSPSQRDQN